MLWQDVEGEDVELCLPLPFLVPVLVLIETGDPGPLELLPDPFSIGPVLTDSSKTISSPCPLHSKGW